MDNSKAEYGVQPAYNQNLLPSCPPSYSEAVASSPRLQPDANQLPYPNQPGLNSKPVIPHAQPLQAPPSQPQPVQLIQYSGYATQAPAITLPVSVGPKRAHLRCPHCHAQVHTKTKSSVQKSAHYACFLLFLCGCCLCSCIPYCLASFNNVHHHCPECNGFIGTYKG